MDFLDIRTTYLFIGIIYMLMPAITWFTLSNDKVRPVYMWCIGSLMFGSGLSLISFRDQIPDWISFEVANGLIISGQLLHIQAVRFDFGRPFRKTTIAGLALIYILIFSYLHLVLKSDLFRLEFAFFSLSMTFLLLGHAGWQLNRYSNSRNAYSIAVVYGLMAILSFLRLFELALKLAPTNILLSNASGLRVNFGALFASIIGHFGYMGISLDRMTQQKIVLATTLARQEENLANEAKLSTILDGVEGYIYIKDVNYRYVYANRKVCELFDLPLNAIVGRDDADFFDQASAKHIRCNDQRVIEGGERVEQEEINTTADGKITTAFYSIKIPLRGQDGAIEALCGVSTDITQLKEMENKLLESEVQYRTLADLGPALIKTLDTNRRLDYVNNGWLNFTGRSLEQLLNDGWMQDIHADDRNRYVSILNSAFSLESNYCLNFRFRNGDNTYRWIEEQGCPRYDSHDRFIGYICYSLDITDRKDLENNAQEAKTRFMEQIAQLDRQRSLGEMSASLGHELNQPLTAILTNAQVLKRGIEKGQIQIQQFDQFIDPIIQNTRRANQIIEKIRSFIRPQSVERQRVDIDQIARETAELVMPDAVRHKVVINFINPNQPVWVMGDAIQLSQVLLNILRNGIEALKGADDRQIYVNLASSDEYVRLNIHDTGPGLSAEALEKVGAPFYTTKPDGLGMGLSISRTIIEQHNGELLISNGETGGANFEIVLPGNG